MMFKDLLNELSILSSKHALAKHRRQRAEFEQHDLSVQIESIKEQLINFVKNKEIQFTKEPSL